MLPDLRYAIRSFRSAPGFAAVLILILAVGIGANTAMFTLVSNILWRPLPSPEGHRIMHIGTSSLSSGTAVAPVSYPEFLDWKSEARGFNDLSLSWNTPPSTRVTGSPPPNRCRRRASRRTRFPCFGFRPCWDGTSGRARAHRERLLDAGPAGIRARSARSAAAHVERAGFSDLNICFSGTNALHPARNSLFFCMALPVHFSPAKGEVSRE
jgi:hypothetical protein